MGRAYSMRGGDEKFIRNLWLENLQKGKEPWKYNVYERIILICI
jgi:hypothetical protein